jgi:hypothetical protein
MASFEVKLKDGTVEVIEGADAYQPDGQFTTFFALEEGRSVVDCWSVRMASIRTRRSSPCGAGPSRLPPELRSDRNLG